MAYLSSKSPTRYPKHDGPACGVRASCRTTEPLGCRNRIATFLAVMYGVLPREPLPPRLREVWFQAPQSPLRDRVHVAVENAESCSRFFVQLSHGVTDRSRHA